MHHVWCRDYAPSSTHMAFYAQRLGFTLCFGPSLEVSHRQPTVHVALPMSDVVTNTLFYALLDILVHSAGCTSIINDILGRDFDPKVGTLQIVMTVTGLLHLF